MPETSDDSKLAADGPCMERPQLVGTATSAGIMAQSLSWTSFERRDQINAGVPWPMPGSTRSIMGHCRLDWTATVLLIAMWVSGLHRFDLQQSRFLQRVPTGRFLAPTTRRSSQVARTFPAFRPQLRFSAPGEQPPVDTTPSSSPDAPSGHRRPQPSLAACFILRAYTRSSTPTSTSRFKPRQFGRDEGPMQGPQLLFRPGDSALVRRGKV